MFLQNGGQETPSKRINSMHYVIQLSSVHHFLYIPTKEIYQQKVWESRCRFRQQEDYQNLKRQHKSRRLSKCCTLAFGLLKNLITNGWLFGSLLYTVTVGIVASSTNFAKASTSNSYKYI